MTDDDDPEDELGGLLNWPPSRGPIDPHLPRTTYLPNLQRDLAFTPLKKQNNLKGALGQWLCPYRVSTIRSLTMEQADRLLQIETTQGDSYGRWELDWKRAFPSFYLDFQSIVTHQGVHSLPKPYRLIINPMLVKRVYTSPSKGVVRKTQEDLQTSHGYFLFVVAKELEKIYKEAGYSDDYFDLYFHQMEVEPTGLIKMQYQLHSSPRQVSLATPPNIIRTEYQQGTPLEDEKPEIPQSSKLSRGNARRLRACGAVGTWEAFYDVAHVATLNLQQAHEILAVSRSETEEVTTEHPLFNKYHEREVKLQKEDIPLDEEKDDEESDIISGLKDIIKGFQAEDEFQAEDDGIYQTETVRFYCPHCGGEKAFQYSNCGEVDSDGKKFRHVVCGRCHKEWHEPSIEVYHRRFKSSLFNHWEKCRAEDAPTLTTQIDYPINKIVRLTIPPATLATEKGEYQIMSPGYLFWVLAKEYRRIYSNHEEYGIWGHGISDLNFEIVHLKENGEAELGIGS